MNVQSERVHISKLNCAWIKTQKKERKKFSSEKYSKTKKICNKKEVLHIY